MKKYILSILFALLPLGAVDAANVVLSKGTGVGINVSTDQGVVLSSFSLFVGTFAAAPASVDKTNYQAVIQNFRLFGSAAGTSSPTGTLATATIVRDDFTGTSPASNFNNQQIYLIVADNSDLSKATQIGFYTKSATRTDWVFPADTPGALANIGPSTINFNAVTALAGESAVVDNASGPDTFKLFNVVPEVSSSLLMGLTALGLITRRKR